MENIIVSVKNGCVIDVKAPAGIDVFIRDYDAPEGGANPKLIKTDQDGDEYVEEVW